MQVIHRFVTYTLAVLCLLAGASNALAQVQQARGKSTVTYAGKAAPADIKARALQQAQLKAIETYYAEAGEAETSNFDALRDKLTSNLDRYILDTTVLSENDDAASQKYTVAVRVDLNVASLRNAMKANSAVGKAARSDKSSLAFVFVSRQVDSLKVYDARVYKRAEGATDASAKATSSKQGTEGESVAKSQLSTNASMTETANVQTRAVATTETGGSVTRKSSESTWRLFPSANLNQVFTQTFSGAGFRVQEAAFVEAAAQGKFQVAAVENDYRSGNDLKSATLVSIASGMRAAGVPYVALGTLDVGIAEADLQTGLMRVGVTVNARIVDVTQAIPETIVSVGPTTYAGRGPTEDEARTNALKLAANSAARELASQLNAQGVR